MSQLIDNLNSIDSIKGGIKSAIEEKGVDMTGLSFPDYPAAISSIQTGGNYGQLSVNDNGTYSPGTYGVDAFDEVVVSVPSPQFVTESLSVSVNGTYTPGQGVDGYSQVVVDVPQSVTGYTEKYLTEMGQFITDINNSASVVGEKAFNEYGTLKTVTLSNCTNIKAYAFAGCVSLESVYLPILPSWEGFGIFSGCVKLSQINLPVCISVNSNAFYACWNLSEVNLPICTYIGAKAFYSCSKIQSIDLPVCGTLDSSCFYRCSSLSQITLRSTNVCVLYASTNFSGTKIWSGTGSIYVPSSLVDEYKSAANWSYFSSVIFPISE